MVTIVSKNNLLLIEAYELNKIIAYSSASQEDHYRRWLNMNVFGHAIHGYDYYTIPGEPLFPDQTKKVGRKRNSYVYFSLDFAIAICLLEKSQKSRRVRNFLIEQKIGKTI